MKYIVRLSSEERKILLDLIDKGVGGKEKLNRARILLKADCGEERENWHDENIAEAFYVSISTVERTRKTLVEEGFEAALVRKQQLNRKKCIIQGEEEAHLVVLTCSEPPPGHNRWTLRLLADKMVELNYVESVSYETVRNTLKKTKLSHGKKKNGAYLLKQMPDLSAKWKKC